MTYIILFNLIISTVLVPPNSEIHIQQGLNYAYQEKYDSAFYHFHQAVDSNPQHPSGYFFLAYLCDLYNNDLLTTRYQEDFNKYSEQTIELSENLMVRYPSSGHFYKGAMLFSQALNHAYQGNYLGALRLATPAYYELGQAIQSDNTLYDAKLGIGAYKFLKGTLESSLFMNNSLIDEGIADIQDCAEHGSYLNIAAKNLLALLLLEKGDTDQSINYARQLVQLFPRSRTFHWALLKNYVAIEDFPQVIKTGETLVQLIKSGPIVPPGNLAYVYMEMAEAYRETGDVDTAKQFCNQILSLPTDSYTREFKVQAQEFLRKNI